MQKELTEIPLKDIYLPESVHWWPLAPGWWIVLFIVLALISCFYWGIKRYRKKWGYRHTALALLKKDYDSWKKLSSDQRSDKSYRLIESMLIIVKRTALNAYSNQEISALYGKKWVDFLNQQTGTRYFSSDLESLIFSQQYRPQNTLNLNNEHIDTFYLACQQWIKHHKTDTKNKIVNGAKESG